VLNYKVVADGIKGVFVPAGNERLGQSFVELEVEDLESQRLSGSDFVQVSCQPRCVLRTRGNEQAEGIQGRFHFESAS
jgi:hypothetical protein